MPKATRKGDIGSSHGCFPPSPAIEGSGDVFINGKPAVRVGDAYAAHGLVFVHHMVGMPPRVPLLSTLMANHR